MELLIYKRQAYEISDQFLSELGTHDSCCDKLTYNLRAKHCRLAQCRYTLCPNYSTFWLPESNFLNIYFGLDQHDARFILWHCPLSRRIVTSVIFKICFKMVTIVCSHLNLGVNTVVFLCGKLEYECTFTKLSFTYTDTSQQTPPPPPHSCLKTPNSQLQSPVSCVPSLVSRLLTPESQPHILNT